MSTTTLYEIETSEGDDGSTHPAEQLWTPCAGDVADSGFVTHQGLYVTGIDDATDDHLYPGDDPSVLIPRIPRAVHTHGVFLRHPHPGHGCGCEWDDTWRMVWAPATEPGAAPITALRHPAAPAAVADLPNPDHGEPATWAP
ncbi:hypothetical protein [Streptomyces sp. NPDC059970]|uniref:hypothetical protein n=1 Tax=Streptomyces sp. NPDC059970 TaxID=3347019 RepID=UPI0036D13051